jgi:predicted NBD/HSP70 family sugar kinase
MQDSPQNLSAESMHERTLGEMTALRGTNQSGMRDHNERLVLSLVRRAGPLAKAEIARITGLSAQTTSVIMRALERDGLLQRGAAVRGRIGQPSIPMALAADGAFFIGLKIGRRSADLTLVDFLGGVRGIKRKVYRFPTPAAVVGFVRAALPDLTTGMPADHLARLKGLGVAMPFQLWNWVQALGAPQAEMDAWRDIDLHAELTAATGLPVYVQNDATSACGAELVFGTGERPKDFLYVYVGTFIGGGLVLNGQLFLGRTGNAAGIGPMPVPAGPGHHWQRLLDVASLSRLVDLMEAIGESADHIWEQPDIWHVSEPVLADWIAAASEGLAVAIVSAGSLLELEAVLIDGWMPTAIRARLTESTRAALARLDLAGLSQIHVREGTVGAQARSLGAAAIPLSQSYLIDWNAAARSGL